MEEEKYYNEAGKMLTGESPAGSDNANLGDLQEIWNLAGSYSYKESAGNDKAWEAMSAKIATPVLQVSWLRRNVWAVAASAAFLVAVSAGVLFWKNESVAPLTAALHEKTGNQEFKDITLADGSKISLLSNSEITVAEGFNQSNRHVQLRGQAIFEVARNEALAFEVKTAKSQTKVLGTGFQIKAFDNENVVIEVLHGKVQFGTGTDHVVLLKGESAAVDFASSAVSKTVQFTTHFSGEGFVFKKATLKSISEELKHHYGKGLVFDDSNGDKEFTGKFAANAKLEDIAKTLQTALGVTITAEK